MTNTYSTTPTEVSAFFGGLYEKPNAQFLNEMWDLFESREFKEFRGKVNFLLGRVREKNRNANLQAYRPLIVEQILKDFEKKVGEKTNEEA